MWVRASLRIHPPSPNLGNFQEVNGRFEAISPSGKGRVVWFHGQMRLIFSGMRLRHDPLSTIIISIVVIVAIHRGSAFMTTTVCLVVAMPSTIVFRCYACHHTAPSTLHDDSEIPAFPKGSSVWTRRHSQAPAGAALGCREGSGLGRIRVSLLFAKNLSLCEAVGMRYKEA